MATIEKLMRMLKAHDVDAAVAAEIMRGSEGITDQRKLERPAFILHAMQCREPCRFVYEVDGL